jgi:hypothetical protein
VGIGVGVGRSSSLRCGGGRQSRGVGRGVVAAAAAGGEEVVESLRLKGEIDAALYFALISPNNAPRPSIDLRGCFSRHD